MTSPREPLPIITKVSSEDGSTLTKCLKPQKRYRTEALRAGSDPGFFSDIIPDWSHVHPSEASSLKVGQVDGPGYVPDLLSCDMRPGVRASDIPPGMRSPALRGANRSVSADESRAARTHGVSGIQRSASADVRHSRSTSTDITQSMSASTDVPHSMVYRDTNRWGTRSLSADKPGGKRNSGVFSSYTPAYVTKGYNREAKRSASDRSRSSGVPSSKVPGYTTREAKRSSSAEYAVDRMTRSAPSSIVQGYTNREAKANIQSQEAATAHFSGFAWQKRSTSAEACLHRPVNAESTVHRPVRTESSVHRPVRSVSTDVPSSMIQGYTNRGTYLRRTCSDNDSTDVNRNPSLRQHQIQNARNTFLTVPPATAGSIDKHAFISVQHLKAKSFLKDIKTDSYTHNQNVSLSRETQSQAGNNVFMDESDGDKLKAKTSLEDIKTDLHTHNQNESPRRETESQDSNNVHMESSSKHIGRSSQTYYDRHNSQKLYGARQSVDNQDVNPLPQDRQSGHPENTHTIQGCVDSDVNVNIVTSIQDVVIQSDDTVSPRDDCNNRRDDIDVSVTERDDCNRNLEVYTECLTQTGTVCDNNNMEYSATILHSGKDHSKIASDVLHSNAALDTNIRNDSARTFDSVKIQNETQREGMSTLKSPNLIIPVSTSALSQEIPMDMSTLTSPDIITQPASVSPIVISASTITTQDKQSTSNAIMLPYINDSLPSDSDSSSGSHYKVQHRRFSSQDNHIHELVDNVKQTSDHLTKEMLPYSENDTNKNIERGTSTSDTHGKDTVMQSHLHVNNLLPNQKAVQTPSLSQSDTTVANNQNNEKIKKVENGGEIVKGELLPSGSSDDQNTHSNSVTDGSMMNARMEHNSEHIIEGGESPCILHRHKSQSADDLLDGLDDYDDVTLTQKADSLPDILDMVDRNDDNSNSQPRGDALNGSERFSEEEEVHLRPIDPHNKLVTTGKVISKFRGRRSQYRSISATWPEQENVDSNNTDQYSNSLKRLYVKHSMKKSSDQSKSLPNGVNLSGNMSVKVRNGVNLSDSVKGESAVKYEPHTTSLDRFQKRQRFRKSRPHSKSLPDGAQFSTNLYYSEKHPLQLKAIQRQVNEHALQLSPNAEQDNNYQEQGNSDHLTNGKVGTPQQNGQHSHNGVKTVAHNGGKAFTHNGGKAIPPSNFQPKGILKKSSSCSRGMLGMGELRNPSEAAVFTFDEHQLTRKSKSDSYLGRLSRAVKSSIRSKSEGSDPMVKSPTSQFYEPLTKSPNGTSEDITSPGCTSPVQKSFLYREKTPPRCSPTSPYSNYRDKTSPKCSPTNPLSNYNISTIHEATHVSDAETARAESDIKAGQGAKSDTPSPVASGTKRGEGNDPLPSVSSHPKDTMFTIHLSDGLPDSLPQKDICIIITEGKIIYITISIKGTELPLYKMAVTSL